MAAGTGVCFCSIRSCKMGDKSKMSVIYTQTLYMALILVLLQHP